LPSTAVVAEPDWFTTPNVGTSISWTCVRTAHLARADHLGPQTNLHTGDVYELTPAHLADLAALRVERITHPERYFLLMRSGDELLDWREAVADYAGAYQYIAGGGSHGWEDIDDEMPSVLRFAGVIGAVDQCGCSLTALT